MRRVEPQAHCGQGSATSNTVYTLVGTVSNAGYTNDDGYYGSALIYYPEGVAVANGNLFIGQTGAGANAGVRVVYGQG